MRLYFDDTWVPRDPEKWEHRNHAPNTRGRVTLNSPSQNKSGNSGSDRQATNRLFYDSLDVLMNIQ